MGAVLIGRYALTLKVAFCFNEAHTCPPLIFCSSAAYKMTVSTNRAAAREAKTWFQHPLQWWEGGCGGEAPHAPLFLQTVRRTLPGVGQLVLLELLAQHLLVELAHAGLGHALD